MHRSRPVKQHDCRLHGVDSGAELFVVEGDSAAKSVCRVRDSRFQAVLPMQGKPVNAIRASRDGVQRNALFRELMKSIGADWDSSLDLANLRFSRIILLFDPDADGIHCGALMSMFFYRWLRGLVDARRLFLIRPPGFELTSPATGETIHAYHEMQYKRICRELDRQNIAFESRRYRGLASMNDDALTTTCIDPATRNLESLTATDIESAIGVLMGGVRDKRS